MPSKSITRDEEVAYICEDLAAGKFTDVDPAVVRFLWKAYERVITERDEAIARVRNLEVVCEKLNTELRETQERAEAAEAELAKAHDEPTRYWRWRAQLAEAKLAERKPEPPPIRMQSDWGKVYGPGASSDDLLKQQAIKQAEPAAPEAEPISQMQRDMGGGYPQQPAAPEGEPLIDGETFERMDAWLGIDWKDKDAS